MRLMDPRVKEIHKAIEALEKHGWIAESVTFKDDAGEPFRFRLQMRFDPPRKTDVL